MQGIFFFLLKKGLHFFPYTALFPIKTTKISGTSLPFFKGCAAILLSILTDICCFSAAPDCPAASAGGIINLSLRSDDLFCKRSQNIHGFIHVCLFFLIHGNAQGLFDSVPSDSAGQGNRNACPLLKALIQHMCHRKYGIIIFHDCLYNIGKPAMGNSIEGSSPSA